MESEGGKENGPQVQSIIFYNNYLYMYIIIMYMYMYMYILYFKWSKLVIIILFRAVMLIVVINSY